MSTTEQPATASRATGQPDRTTHPLVYKNMIVLFAAASLFTAVMVPQTGANVLSVPSVGLADHPGHPARSVLSCNRGAAQERMSTALPRRSLQDLEFSVG
jgi:hypothetical protein